MEMNKLHAGKDGILLHYMECFYQARYDHDRAIVGALIVGTLETILASHIDENDIENVDAIPIDWIEKFMESPIGGSSVEDMLREWKYKCEIEVEKMEEEA